jgi:Ca-activated chloride channel family protein
MNTEDRVSQLSLERYNRGKVSSNERKFIEAALESDTQLRLLYEELKKSDGEIRLLYPLENLPQLAAIKDTVVPIPIDESSSRTRFQRIWYRAKKVKWGLAAAAALVCVVFSGFYFMRWRSHNNEMAESPNTNRDLREMEAALLEREQMTMMAMAEEEFLSMRIKPRTPGLAYDDSELSSFITRSKSTSTTTWHGTGFNPEGPAGLEGQVPPAFKDMSNLYGKMTQENFNTSEFDHITDNPFRRVIDNQLSTFSVDVDTAGYSITRYFLMNGRKPPKSAVRIEELINYFDYNYSPPTDGKPFAVHVETGAAPWNPNHLLARIALKGKEFPANGRPKVNLVFLLDVSGSMDEPNRLPLVISSMKMLVNELKGTDKVAICVYAGAAGTVLPTTSGDRKPQILASLDKLQAGGSTAGGEGIQLAYKLAEEGFDPNAVNRVILCTDGDFNVGVSNRSDLVDMISAKAKNGVYLSVLGFGMDNYRDGTLKQLASKGNGNYGYIDNIEEARKILVEQLSGTLITIAQDVKIQVEFNPETVGAYRLIGYENRLLRKEDFNDDTIDAGDIGAGHIVTAFYELIPKGVEDDAARRVDPLKYGSPVAPPAVSNGNTDELLTVKLRYKLPKENESSLLSFPVLTSSVRKAGEESGDFRFASAVAGFGMLLRDSPYKGNAGFDSILNMAQTAIGKDESGYRRGFLEMIKKAQAIGN